DWRRAAVGDDGPPVGQWQWRLDAGVAVWPLRGLVCLLGVGDAEHDGAGDDGGDGRADERLHDAPPCLHAGCETAQTNPSSSQHRSHMGPSATGHGSYWPGPGSSCLMQNMPGMSISAALSIGLS